jgi:hypothetical protein
VTEIPTSGKKNNLDHCEWQADGTKSDEKKVSVFCAVLSCSATVARLQGCQMVYFQTKKSQFGSILVGLAMEDVGIF